ncbi:acetyl-CoA C-acyltransferase [Alishewanella sp. SMS8]|uniref:acetyl-CoA C-acyltransferase n=1 Tax=Alishewanella sp. SMS8 TaxID=2994676 RepID=UPI0027423729|nr:acetyl-CoA C-acyltransferase [Alishewanella sp. SMS8]MDP4944117.1 acetyl-CoA C-acyltransferase [Alishewanella sp.]MDP5037177.1 acetyl-CoA C-acyltransferase [Alishewanella sp.]MDP5187231.1 acetyl-CoA C-acyltransferase [Alishewanella sp.]MDP5460195.1 acetyl-CoA C-acyltransferase [Alishewanella sp. SMS8]
MNPQNPVVIVAARRTAMGGFMGGLSEVDATLLGAAAIKAAMADAGIAAEKISEVIMGNVLPAGLGQAPARQATLKAGLPLSAGATTINKVCGSGLKAVMLASDLLHAGSADVVVAGGMESMSNAPYLLPKARSGYRMGHGEMKDHMMLDGLENAYDGKAMGCFAQNTANDKAINREQMDAFAVQSLTRAQSAISSGAFVAEITPVTFQTRKGEITFNVDEQPGNAKLDKIPTLRPAFAKDGTITAANSSSISDGAAALVLMRLDDAKALGAKPLARVVAHSTHSIEPENFTVAPVGAMQKLLKKTGWQKDEVDLWEINEAFAMVTMLAVNELGLDNNKVNVNGGACALGHPIGASGARILVTLIHALRNRGLSKGIASLCIGGGEAVALAVEVM